MALMTVLNEGNGDFPSKPRWSANRKMDVVLRLLRGEKLEELSRELGVDAHRLAAWRDEFLEGGKTALRGRASSGGETHPACPPRFSASATVAQIQRSTWFFARFLALPARTRLARFGKFLGFIWDGRPSGTAPKVARRHPRKGPGASLQALD
jgi:transposase-like protein